MGADMAHALHPHPATKPERAWSLAAAAFRPKPDILAVRFVLEGHLEAVIFPEAGPGGRTDGLWQSTCFEAFVRVGKEEGYYEFNLSPSCEWAAYRFDSYRSGMADAEIVPPVKASEGGEERRVFRATLMPLPADVEWHVGLSAVIEERDGTKSYWALRHPPGKPDFHHRDCFALELPPAARS